MRHVTKYSWAMMLLLVVSLFNSCKKDEETEAEVIASFTYTVDADNFKLVAFTSAAQNYASLSWNFGDASAVSAVVNPTHEYAEVGVYTVTLTATSPKGATDVFSTDITIADPNAELTKLVGDVSKTWKLIRTVVPNYPIECGPWDHSTIWWALGKDNDLALRPCMLNDEWTFNRDGSMVFNANGDYWAEGGMYTPDNQCADVSAMVGVHGEDLSPLGSGTHAFRLIPGSDPKLRAIGVGAFIGFSKQGAGAEIPFNNPMVLPDSITYNIVKLTDATIDTLIIESQYQWDASPGGYWKFTLVHYDNPADEPPLPGPKPVVGFTYAFDGLTATFTNTTTGADSYLWDFGDGQTSTDANPVHTYTEGIFDVSLTATNTSGVSVGTANLFVTVTELTDALLQGGAWKVRVEEKSIFVGGGLGMSNWWSVPKAFMVSGTGGDDWTCIADDEFTFSTGGVFTYNTNGSARNDGYFGGTNGCIDDAGIAASGNGAAFGSATHSYVLTPATADTRPIITLTNGAGFAAFIGFYKGYYGGENTNSANPPNGGFTTNVYQVMGYANTGTKEYLFVSVDLSPDHTGGSAWSAILER